MEKYELDKKMAEVSKTVLSYCMARTSDWHDAEDLAQDIMLQITRSAPNIRDDSAIYAFMWSAAKNVCKQWLRKRQRAKICELPENIHDENGDLDIIFDEKSDIYLLRRELSLLSEKYRRATILYYLHNKSCSEIASLLSVSESMVKYLLFKSRSILKEGMIMERSYGEQSYNPRNLNILYMGEGPNHYWNLADGSKIRQNILWACYNDRLTEDEIALQIGVSLPYIEDDLKKLTETWLLRKDGNYYKTNIIILTEDYNLEKDTKLIPLQRLIADKLQDFINTKEKEIREIDFYGSDMTLNSLRWHVATMILFYAYSVIGDNYFTNNAVPVTAFGEHAFVWGAEKVASGFNCCSINASEWKTNISIYFMDWLKHPNMRHNDFYGNPKWVKVYDKLSNGLADNLNEYEQEITAEFIRKGYAINRGGKIMPAMPVYTKEQFQRVVELQKDIVSEIGSLFKEIHRICSGILNNHVPAHLKKQVNAIAGMSVFNDGAGVPAGLLYKNGYLSDNWTAGEIATSYVVRE